MGVTEELADKLAADTIDAMDELGDDRLFEEIAKALGSSSQTSEEAFLTAVRVRLAERRARRLLESRLAAGGSRE